MHHVICLAAGLLFASFATASEPARWGTYLGAGLMFNCPASGDCRGDTKDVSSFHSQSFETNLLVQSTADYGDSKMQVTLRLVHNAFFPKMSGYTRVSGVNSHHGSASAVVIEGYQYLGDTPTELEFDTQLTGTNLAAKGMEALIYFFRRDSFVYTTSLADLVTELHLNVITNFALNISRSTNGTNVAKQVKIPVQPKELFYLYTSVWLSAWNEASVPATVESLEVNCSQADSLLSESLFAPQPQVEYRAGKYNVWVPASRWPVRLQGSSDLLRWFPLLPRTDLSGTTISNTLPARAGQSFIRVQPD